jgi:hypothetical protein
VSKLARTILFIDHKYLREAAKKRSTVSAERAQAADCQFGSAEMT